MTFVISYVHIKQSKFDNKDNMGWTKIIISMS